jgi:hypothetical protein
MHLIPLMYFILNYTFRSVIRPSSDDIAVFRMQCDQMCQIKYISGIKYVFWVLDTHYSDVFVKHLLSAGDVPTFIMSLSVIKDLTLVNCQHNSCPGCRKCMQPDVPLHVRAVRNTCGWVMYAHSHVHSDMLHSGISSSD